MNVGVSIEQIEFFLLILVRCSAFIFLAPFFTSQGVPARVKAGMSVLLALTVSAVTPVTELMYTSVIGYGVIVLKEAVAGAAMGFFANIAQHILAFVGQRMDMDMGFSMATEYNASLGGEITVTASLYTYAVTLIMFVTNFHLFFIRAIADSFKLIPVGGVVIDTNIYLVMVRYMTDYFIIGFRIVLPLYAAILIVDTILGILAKVAPQMNMFAVGIQLKIAVGLFVLFFMIRMLPGVSTMIYEEMVKLLKTSVQYLGGS